MATVTAETIPARRPLIQKALPQAAQSSWTTQNLVFAGMCSGILLFAVGLPLVGGLLAFALKGDSSPLNGVIGPKTWTIELGTVKTGEDFYPPFKKGGIRHDFCTTLNIPIAPQRTTVKLVMVEVGDLGFKHQPTTEEFYEAAQKRGYQLCPAEVGPQLRLKYTDQPEGESLFIAMNPIDNSGLKYFKTYDKVYVLEHNERGQWLTMAQRHMNTFLNLNDQFVFVKP